MRRLSLTIVALWALPLQGCCSLARLFCGPDSSPWISVNFQTPELAVRTFLEALRRDDPDVIYQALSDSYREDLEIDNGITRMAWPKIRERNPGLHLAGYAEVPAVTVDDAAGTAYVELDVEGHAVVIQLTRQCHWQVRYRRPGAPAAQREADVSVNVPDPGQQVIVTSVSEDPPTSLVDLNALRITHYGVDEIPIDNLDFVGMERTWHISGLRMPTPE